MWLERPRIRLTIAMWIAKARIRINIAMWIARARILLRIVRTIRIRGIGIIKTMIYIIIRISRLDKYYE